MKSACVLTVTWPRRPHERPERPGAPEETPKGLLEAMHEILHASPALSSAILDWAMRSGALVLHASAFAFRVSATIDSRQTESHR